MIQLWSDYDPIMMTWHDHDEQPGCSEDPKDSADKEVSPEGERGVVGHRLL